MLSLTVFLLLQSLRTTGEYQGLWLTLFGSAAGYLLVIVVDFLRRIPRRYLQLISHGILISTVAVLLRLYWRDAIHVVPPYPGDSIAMFNSGRGGPAITDLGQPLSIMSDSVQNNASKVWYERAEERTNAETNGFLRLYYELEPGPRTEAFVGVFADFTLPPPQPFDMTAFAGISLRLRIAQDSGERPDVRVVLYSDNVQSPTFAYPMLAIPGRDLSVQWRQESLPFENFAKPPFATSPVHLDPQRIFRIGLVIVGDAKVHGHVDIDDLRFFRVNAGH